MPLLVLPPMAATFFPTAIQFANVLGPLLTRLPEPQNARNYCPQERDRKFEQPLLARYMLHLQLLIICYRRQKKEKNMATILKNIANHMHNSKMIRSQGDSIIAAF